MKITIRGGVLKDERGDRIGKIKKAEVEFEEDWLALAVQRLAGAVEGDYGGGAVAVDEQQKQLTVEVDEGSGEKAERIPVADIQAVWGCYAETMNPRSKELGADERKIIRDALRVASVDECRKAILGCASSDFHMGKNTGRKKYNSLTRILKGRRGKETTRERIDFFIDKLAEAGGASSGVPSASRDLIEQRKRDVQRGHRFRDRPEMVEKAKEAEAWLEEQGITVARDKDGYPTFRWDGV